jgi:hypothetical protein
MLTVQDIRNPLRRKIAKFLSYFPNGAVGGGIGVIATNERVSAADLLQKQRSDTNHSI